VDDAHGYGMRDEQFAEHAAELVEAQVDVITAAGDVAVRAAQQATKTIPILASGLIWSEQASWHHLPSPVAT
jgi:hypothetical protein